MTVEQRPILREADHDKAAYSAFASAQFRILKDYMKVAGLNTYSRVVTLANGVVITCQKSFNREDIFISVPQSSAVAVGYTEVITLITLTEFEPVLDSFGEAVLDPSTGEPTTLLPDYEFTRMQDLTVHEFTAPMYASYWFFRPATDDSYLKTDIGTRCIDVANKTVISDKGHAGTNNWQDGSGNFLTWLWYGDRYFWGAKHNRLYTASGMELVTPNIVRGAGVMKLTSRDGSATVNAIIVSGVDGKFHVYAPTAASPSESVWSEILEPGSQAFMSMPLMYLPVFFTYTSDTAYAYKDRFYVVGTADYLVNHTGFVHKFTFSKVFTEDTDVWPSIMCAETLEDNQQILSYDGPTAWPERLTLYPATWGLKELIHIDATDTIVKLHHVDGVKGQVAVYPQQPGVQDEVAADGRTEMAVTIYNGLPMYYLTGSPTYIFTFGSSYVCNGVVYDIASESRIFTGTMTSQYLDASELIHYLLPHPVTPAVLTVPVSFDLRKKDILICTLLFTKPVGTTTNCTLQVCGEPVVNLGSGSYIDPADTQFRNFSLSPDVTNDPNTQTVYIHSIDPAKAFVFVSWRYAVDKVITYCSQKVRDESGDAEMYFKSMTDEKPYFISSKQYFQTGLIKRTVRKE